ncbi:GFA family protein [Paraburkholderia sp.]|uniref:GFA family protein n=1 Tax=Paraburkholderia sp. TaxID=1926495 RepID=UPI0039E65122
MPDRKGGCLCGAVRYVLNGEPQATAICHCTHCQKQSGSLFSFNLFVRESDYEQQGETRAYEDRGDSGEPSWRHFCGRCGSPVLTKVSSLPGLVLVKAGTLDSMEGLPAPQTEIYTDRAVKWLEPFAGATRFALSP